MAPSTGARIGHTTLTQIKYVTSATAQQGIVGSVDNGINLQTSNVTLVKRYLKASLNPISFLKVHYFFCQMDILIYLEVFKKFCFYFIFLS